MTTEQIILIKKSWKTFRGIKAGTIGDLFYTKLFTDYPTLRKMFPSNMEVQNKKLIDMLDAIVIHIDHLDKMTEEMAAMGIRHHDVYGVQPEHYKIIGDTLIWTLQKGMGKDWDDAIKHAWINCYSEMSAMMLAPKQCILK